MNNFFRQLLSTPQSQTLEPQEARRRVLAIRLHLITGVLLTLISVPSLLIKPAPELTPDFIGTIATLVMGLLALASAWISYRYSATRGSLIFIAAILLISLGIPFYANGLGLQAGIIVAIIVIAISVTTLPPTMQAPVNVGGILVEAIVVLMDLYLPDYGLGKLESLYINPILVLILLAFLYYLYRQFSAYAFRAKLVIFLVIVAAMTVSAVAISINYISGQQLTQQAGSNVAELADGIAERVGTSLASEIRLLQTAGTQFEESAYEANYKYTGKSESQIRDEIAALDTKWRAGDITDPLIQRVLNNSMSKELKEFQEIAPQHVELFITDQYGANIASSNLTSDYYQADEDWWQAGYNGGKGAIYISQPELDESSNTYALLIAIPLIHEGEVVGILRSTLDVTFLTTLLENEPLAESQQQGIANLRIAHDQLLTKTLSPSEVTSLNQIQSAYGEMSMDGIPSLVSEQQITSPTDDAATDAITALNWSVIVHQDVNETLEAAEAQSRATVTIAMAVLILTALLGYVVSQRLAAPIVALTEVTSAIANGNLHARANIQTQDEIGELASSFNSMSVQLQETLKGLEQRVADRTSDLSAARNESERRATELQAISEISSITASEQRLEILLPLITRLVSEKLGFYHVGIFLLDPTRQFAALQAANSEGGQRMLNRGHRLDLGKGIVGTVAQIGAARVALDVGTDAVFFDNPDLPATRSEVALPLNVRGETIGVLDVQSTRPGEFEESNVNTLSILGDQIAIAIENARLFTRTQQALSEAQALYNQYLKKEWKTFRSKTTNVGYHQSVTGGKPLENPVESAEIQKAIQQGEIVRGGENGSQTEPSMIVPIKLRGETIGVLNIKAPAKNRQWSRDEINMIESVSERLALALENARLFDETNRRAERERIVSEITGKIRSVNDPQTMIQTALEELRSVLGASRVQVIPSAPGDGK